MSAASPEVLRDTQTRMRGAAERLRLVFPVGGWNGPNGALRGSGPGSSIEYHDHRPYLPGDDPRDLDWRAYARTGQYTLKLYREEVSPRVDLVLDQSRSMALESGKARRSLELFYFCAEAALRARAALACHGVTQSRATSLDAALAGSWPAGEPRNDPARAPDLAAVPWRARSLRIWISDLLFAQEPGRVLSGLLPTGGRAVILAPYCTAEAEPDWSGSTELVDVEGGVRRMRQLDARALARYREAYTRHFALWQQTCRRWGVPLVRISSEGSFEDALCAEGVASGAVTLWT